MISISALAQTESEFQVESWLDSSFRANEIDWQQTKAEFLLFSKTNFKKTSSVSEFFLALRESSSPKGEKKQDLIKDSFEGLKAFKQKSEGWLPLLEDHLLSVIKLNSDWCVMDNLKSVYFTLRYINYYSPENFIAYTLSNKLINLSSKIESDTFFEKISILIFLQKVYSSSQPKSFEEIALARRNELKACETGSETFGSKDSTYETTENETEPCFLGGEKGLVYYISEMVLYPQLSREMGEQGSVYVQFVVNRDGSISDVCVLRSPSDLLSREAIRIILAMPTWLAGSQNGEAVRIRYTIPILFKIS